MIDELYSRRGGSILASDARLTVVARSRTTGCTATRLPAFNPHAPKPWHEDAAVQSLWLCTLMIQCKPWNVYRI